MTKEESQNNDNMVKPISWLLDKKFFVPKYQRGYRWTENQVKALLDDIYEFAGNKQNDDEFYCLQPLVVKKNGDRFNLIDGQQRLTTIVLVIKYFNEMWRGKQKLAVPYLAYETRDESKEFIEKLEIDNISSLKDLPIDFYHIVEAYKTIDQWVHNKGNNLDDSKFQSVFLHNTKIIWYEIDETEEEIDSFIRINSGKIPLTNAELIKALFLQKKNFDQESETSIRRYEMAEDWDRIEHKLQDNSFWYFLTTEEPKSYSRIDFIFDLIYENESGVQKDEPLTTYLFFHKKANSADWHISSQWEQIKNVFDTLCEWYEDYERYHCIGYLIYAGKRIPDLYKTFLGKKKNEVMAELKKLMKGTIKNCFDEKNMECLVKYGEQSAEGLRRFYVLYNILCLLKTERNFRFPFDKLKIEKWDIEHIDSRTENPLEKLKDQKEWLQTTYSDLKNELDDFTSKIEAYQERKEADANEFSALYKDIIEKVRDKNIDENTFGNLTLLDAGTNRAYKNALFPTKRRFIIERDKEGKFIPPCTKNVFLKYYQDGAVELRKWTADDVEKYEEAIEDTFADFFKGVK